MNISISNQLGVAAIINYKDGRKRHGLIINQTNEEINFRFLSYDQILNSEDGISAIEIIPAALIEAIETDLK